MNSTVTYIILTIILLFSSGYAQTNNTPKDAKPSTQQSWVSPIKKLTWKNRSGVSISGSISEIKNDSVLIVVNETYYTYKIDLFCDSDRELIINYVKYYERNSVLNLFKMTNERDIRTNFEYSDILYRNILAPLHNLSYPIKFDKLEDIIKNAKKCGLFEPNFPAGKKVDEVARIRKDNIEYIKWLERSVDIYITKLRDDRIVIQ